MRFNRKQPQKCCTAKRKLCAIDTRCRSVGLLYCESLTAFNATILGEDASNRLIRAWCVH